MNDEPLQLTDEQKVIVMQWWDKEDISSLTKRVSGNTQIDGRSTLGLAIKAYLAGMSLIAKTSKYAPFDPIVLTEDQKKKVEDLAPSTSGVLELTRLVFEDPTLRALTREYRAVHAHYKTVYPMGVDATDEPTDDMDYKPPQTIQILCGQVNDYVPTGDVGKKLYNWGKLKISEERQLRALMAYVRVFGFKCQANQYQRKIDRTLFISTFMRFTHDKPDLTAEEVDQYIKAAAETVNILQVERGLQRFDNMMQDILTGDAESRGRFMPMVELINATRGKLDQSKKTLQGVLESLVGTRNKRIQDQSQRNSSILNLFDAWMKDEQKRADIIELGVKEKEEDAREMGRIRDYDDVTAVISGMTFEEASIG